MDEDPTDETDDLLFSPSNNEEEQYITKAIALFCASARLGGRPATHHEAGKEDSEVMAEETISMAMMFERYLTGEME